MNGPLAPAIKLAAALCVMCCPGVLFAQAPPPGPRVFVVNVPESRLEFFVGSSMGDVNGVFSTWTADLKQDTPGVPESATLSVNVVAASITTGSSMKDDVVKGSDYFHVEKYPSVGFASTKVIPTSGDPNKFQVQGNFTLCGVTKPVTLQVTLNRDGKGGGQIYADLSFDRRDFGMTKNMPFVRVSDSVRVRMDMYVTPKQ